MSQGRTCAHQTVRYERECSQRKHPRAEELISGEMSAFEKGGHGRVVHGTYKSKLHNRNSKKGGKKEKGKDGVKRRKEKKKWRKMKKTEDKKNHVRTDPIVQNTPETTSRAHEALKAGLDRNESSEPITSL